MNFLKPIRIILGIAILLLAWFLGYLKVPYIQESYSFWLGFLACSILLFILTTLYWEYRNINSRVSTVMLNQHKNSLSNNVFLQKQLVSISLWLVPVIAVLILYFQKQDLQQKIKMAEEELSNFKNESGLEQQRASIQLILELIHDLDSAKKKVTDTAKLRMMTERIAALSSSFKVYKEWDLENSEFIELSKVRGQLLLTLINSNLEKNSFQYIKENISFGYADLRNANLQELDLSCIDLEFANLQDATINKCNLNNSTLNGANFIGAKLNFVTFIGSHLIASKFDWTKLEEVNLHDARLDSSTICNSTIVKSNLSNASFINSNLSNTLIIQSNLDHFVLCYTKLKNTNFYKSIMTNSIIWYTDLSFASLNDVKVDKNWKKRLIENENLNIDNFFIKYILNCHNSEFQDSSICRLEFIE